MSRLWLCPHDAFGDEEEEPSDEVAWFGRLSFGRKEGGGADQNLVPSGNDPLFGIKLE